MNMLDFDEAKSVKVCGKESQEAGETEVCMLFGSSSNRASSQAESDDAIHHHESLRGEKVLARTCQRC
jgi:hypothetical protein